MSVESEVPPVRVREAAPADLPVVRELVAAAGLPLDGLDDAAHVLLAEVEGAVVGTVALERYDDGDGAVFLLRSAAVDDAWRGCGVGGALTTAALDRVDAARGTAALLTETAAGYFPRFGFTAVDRIDLPAVLGRSAEFRGACPASAHALFRPAGR